MSFKPMLAASLDGVDLSTLHYPLLVSPKLDGIRCIISEGMAYSRNWKPIRNAFIQKWAKSFDNLDGELIVGDPTAPDCMNVTQSGVMSFEGEPDFTYHAFDAPWADGGFEWRYGVLTAAVEDIYEAGEGERIQLVPHEICHTAVRLGVTEEQLLGLGYEGVMLRDPNGPYKQGRSTLREGYLMKLKRFMDGEATVIRVEEAEENQNEAFKDELGRTKRTSHKENKVGKGMVGTIVVQDPTWGEMRLSPGIMPHRERVEWWASGALPGQRVHWRAFGYGVKDKPRFPRFYGFPTDKE